MNKILGLSLLALAGIMAGIVLYLIGSIFFYLIGPAGLIILAGFLIFVVFFYKFN